MLANNVHEFVLRNSYVFPHRVEHQPLRQIAKLVRHDSLIGKSFAADIEPDSNIVVAVGSKAPGGSDPDERRIADLRFGRLIDCNAFTTPILEFSFNDSHVARAIYVDSDGIRARIRLPVAAATRTIEPESLDADAWGVADEDASLIHAGLCQFCPMAEHTSTWFRNHQRGVRDIGARREVQGTICGREGGNRRFQRGCVIGTITLGSSSPHTDPARGGIVELLW